MSVDRQLCLVAMVAVTACGPFVDATGPTLTDEDGEVFCNVPAAELASALAPEAIRALQDPPLVGPAHPGAAYLDPSDRVVGLVVNGEPLAIPLDVLRFHEIANLDRGSARLAVTFCPLTGSSLAFDRGGVGDASLGVSGLLHNNNLVLYDRQEPASFFTQMRSGAATCGPGARTGLSLDVVPSIELEWEAWLAMYPGTLVPSNQTVDGAGFGDYDVNIHEEYERIDNPSMHIGMEIDPRRLPKERVLGVPVAGDGALVFPFEELRRRELRAITALTGSIVVFWDASANAAVAYEAEIDGGRLTFEVMTGGYVDLETGSRWRLDGLAVDGPLAGRRLEPVPGSYVSFWFAWAKFFPETVLWDGL